MIRECSWHVTQRDCMCCVAIEGVHYAKSGVAQADGLFEHRVKHRCEIARRGVDDLQYLRSRGLLLQSLARLGDEPRILDSNDRLGREILQQGGLLVGEWADLHAVDHDVTEYCFVLQQRHEQVGAGSSKID